MKPWLTEQGVFDGGAKEANLQNTSTEKPHTPAIVETSEQGDVVMTGDDVGNKK